MQPVLRWLTADWYVFDGHVLHVRRDATVSADMRSPAPHVGCAMHAVSRWLLDVWYVSAGHALHACVGHFDALGETMASPPSAFVERGKYR